MPSIINFLLKNVELVRHFGYDLGSVKTVLCGSAPIDEKQVDAFLSVFPNVTDFLRGKTLKVNEQINMFFGFGIMSSFFKTRALACEKIWHFFC